MLKLKTKIVFLLENRYKLYSVKSTSNQGLSYLTLTSSDASSCAQICLQQGGRLSKFMFNHTQIIEQYPSATYNDTFASSILFPFANRIKDGKYTFENSTYVLDCNEIKTKNALHGLVYDKQFFCVKKEVSSSSASVTLQYDDDGNSEGFPFKFMIQLTYELNATGIQLHVDIENKDFKAFPCTLGWHPYFVSENLDLSSINFKGTTSQPNNSSLEESRLSAFLSTSPRSLKEIKLDHSFALEETEIEFLTPNYSLVMHSSLPHLFLQLYTPEKSDVIAIEPMTGAVNSFNNKKGLQIIEAGGVYAVSWSLIIETSMSNETSAVL